MKDHSGDIKGFIFSSQAWYSNKLPKRKDAEEEIMIGYYSPDGGTSGELSLTWEDLYDGKKPLIMKINCYEDALDLLKQFNDFFLRLAQKDSAFPQPEEIIELLKEFEFQDITEYQNPNNKKELTQ